MNKKYIYLNNYPGGSGLNDVKDRITEFFKMSIILHLIPILPNVCLSNRHTRKQKSMLFDYIKIPEFVCKTMPSNTEEIFFWNITTFLPLDKLYLKHKKEIHELNFNLEFLDKYKQIASEIVNSLDSPLCCLHVRRGDYLNIHNSLHYTTSPKHIRDVLAKHGDKFTVCYIKSNEKNVHFFDELKKDFNIKLFTDFPILKNIYNSGDNYALYSIECCIRDLSYIKISTFNTTESEQCWLPNFDKTFFIDYLDNHKGYQ